MKKSQIYYARMDELWRKEEKLDYLEKLEHIGNVEWQEIKPDKNYTWLTEGLEDEFGNFLAIGCKETKNISSNSLSFFNSYSMGVSTNRDNWAYNFDDYILIKHIKIFIETYNQQVYHWINRINIHDDLDSFVVYDDKKIKWSSRLKECLRANKVVSFTEKNIVKSLYRPFTSQYLYLDEVLTHRRGQFAIIFPSQDSQNKIICLTDVASEKPFMALVSNMVADLHLSSPGCGTQCFPFYTYNEDGTNRRENITDWALEQYRTHYQDTTITKWDIFHYTYSLLHHPHYRERYAANLKRELPRIPFAPEFHPFATAGKRLAEIHVNYEQQPEYRLKHIENKDLPIDWRVEKMRLSKDKTQIKYNDFLTLADIPPEVFEYRLGNRSALDWIIDQYQVSTDNRSGITNDPNRLDDEEYIVRLIKQVITVSLETVKIVKGLPDLGLPKD